MQNSKNKLYLEITIPFLVKCLLCVIFEVTIFFHSFTIQSIKSTVLQLLEKFPVVDKTMPPNFFPTRSGGCI